MCRLNDEAGRWVVEQAAQGRIRHHPEDEADVVARMLALHLAGEPEMHNQWHVTWARYAAVDIASALKTEKLGRPPRKSGRKPFYPFRDWIAEIERSDAGKPGWLKRESLIARFRELAERTGGRMPSARSLGDYADMIRNKYDQAGKLQDK